MKEAFASTPEFDEPKPQDSEEPVWTYRGYRLKTGISWFEAKQNIIRQAIRTYLKNPTLILHTTA